MSCSTSTGRSDRKTDQVCTKFTRTTRCSPASEHRRPERCGAAVRGEDAPQNPDRSRPEPPSRSWAPIRNGLMLTADVRRAAPRRAVVLVAQRKTLEGKTVAVLAETGTKAASTHHQTGAAEDGCQDGIVGGAQHRFHHRHVGAQRQLAASSRSGAEGVDTRCSSPDPMSLEQFIEKKKGRSQHAAAHRRRVGARRRAQDEVHAKVKPNRTGAMATAMASPTSSRSNTRRTGVREDLRAGHRRHGGHTERPEQGRQACYRYRRSLSRSAGRRTTTLDHAVTGRRSGEGGHQTRLAAHRQYDAETASRSSCPFRLDTERLRSRGLQVRLGVLPPCRRGLLVGLTHACASGVSNDCWSVRPLQ